MSTSISPIGQGGDSLVARLAPMPAPMADLQSAEVSPTGAPAGVEGFGTMLSRAVSGLNQQVTSADRLQEMAASGQLPDPTVAIVATEKADLSLRLAVQVRNRLLEGWQEISRMSV
ncbi:MAG: flagellar hook-basal body complex protein FliE [Thermoleophilia bacterium]|nr:flagellar hook-basal body complex protein FliE [Thermoleophilia bacterium]